MGEYGFKIEVLKGVTTVTMYEVVENQLSYLTFSSIRKKVGFPSYSDEDVKIALQNSLYTVEVKENGETIGIGRMVGDGRILFFIKDVVVDPAFQKHGVGKLIMQNILRNIAERGCDHAYVGLMSTPDSVGFYQQWGFVSRPNSSMGPGMVLYIDKTVPPA